MTQLNTPYPSTAYLTGFLRSREFGAVQEDLALKLVLKLFCREGLTAIRDAVVSQSPDGLDRESTEAAQAIKQHAPHVRTALGGGYVNTELRELADPRVFDDFDFVTLDDGERPLIALLEHLRRARPSEQLVRTFVRVGESPIEAERREPPGFTATLDQSPEGSRPAASGVVVCINHPEPDVAFAEAGTPTWDGLPLDKYLSTLDMLNPMHRLWSDGRWNKLTIAHGCYWKKCSFCDVALDSIGRYDTAAATTLVDRIEAIVAETGQTGFHFADEAAPPKGLKALAEELLRRNVSISWWGNIRFETSFTPELCQLPADSGCVAISGGLEVAPDRLLNLMKKGVSVEQVARVTRGFSDAGILVHAYLMYGFPTQTVPETVDALEYVRQMFEEGCIQSSFFHRFTCTVHSPVGKHPEDYGVTLRPQPPVAFARTTSVSSIPPASITTNPAGPSAKPSTTSCTASGSMRTFAAGLRRECQNPEFSGGSSQLPWPATPTGPSTRHHESVKTSVLASRERHALLFNRT
jgi:radical SAM superfamily enzyme YgiQ (UPF0313 family)